MRTLTTILFLLAVTGMVSCAQGNPEEAGGSCGDQLVDPGEQCDGHNLGGLTCETLAGADFTGGMLQCSSTCELDTSACTGGSGECGNSIVEGAEVCDGADLNGATCESLGLMPGTLVCHGNCLDYDTSGCGVPPTCGNGVRDGLEECDGADLAGATCQILGYLAGTLTCQPNCLFNETGCRNAVCGDSLVEGTEECDGFNLAGTTCMDLGYDGGTLACSASCTFDETLCGNASCGNGVVDGTEECDGPDLAGEDCASLGLQSGTLACSASCTFDTSGCTAPPTCGDGVLNGTEECDGADLGGQDCAGLGFSGGALACSATCTYDTSSCGNQACGNGTVEAGEGCDDGNTIGGDGCSATCQPDGYCAPNDWLDCALSTYSGSMTGADDTIPDFDCGGWAQDDPDNIYAFVATGNGSVTVTLSNCSNDFDLYIVAGACGSSGCLGYSDDIGCPESVTFSVTAGVPYFIAVEEYNGSSGGGFTLSYSCQ